MDDKARIAQLERALSSLYAAVSEQQYTLQSQGWHTTEKCTKCEQEHKLTAGRQWSKAGAVKHQYERVELALRQSVEAIEGNQETLSLARRTERLINTAVEICTVGHSAGCKCLICTFLAEVESDTKAVREAGR